MSTTLSGFLTSIIWGKETTPGTPAASQPYLWNSQESDGLSFGESPLDTKPISGVRGQNSCSLRKGQHLPGGDLGAIPMHFGTDSIEMLLLLLAHFQKVTESGVAAPYTYTFTPVTEAVAEGAFNTLTFSKDTGITDHAHQFAGNIIDALELSWKQGEAIMLKPGVKALNSSNDITMPAIPAVPCGGFMQAPNIAVTWKGSTIHPAAFSIKSNGNYPDIQDGSARGRLAHAVGDYDAAISLDVWRNEDSDSLYVSPFYDEDTGTVVIVATMDTSYGDISGTPVTMTITALCKIVTPNDLPVGDSDLVDTAELMILNDTPWTIAINATSTGLVV